MLLTQKCLYAVRAIFEIAAHHPDGPVKIGHIARAQAIPQRFLEAILTQLKQAGFVESRRGKLGGYVLAKAPSAITVGDIIRAVEGRLGPVECLEEGAEERNGKGCPLYGCCSFSELWQQAREALSRVYDGTTFQDLVDRERKRRDRYVPLYNI